MEVIAMRQMIHRDFVDFVGGKFATVRCGII
jgi:hypothetical protein